MTINEMKKNAKKKMNDEIAYLVAGLSTVRQVRAILCAYAYVGLVSDVEYIEYCDRIRSELYNLENQ